MSTDSLDPIFLNSNIDPDDLIDVLQDYVRILRDTHELYFTDKYFSSSTKEKLLIVLLSEKARKILDDVDDDSLAPVEIAEESEVKLGRAYPELRKLEQKGLIQNTGGAYRIPHRSFDDVYQKLQE